MDLKICVRCGEFFEVPVVPAGEAALVCPECGHRQAFRRLPLFALTGPSGAGKSTVARLLTGRRGDRVVVLEQDVLWMAGLRDPADDYGQFRSTWLRMAAMIHQSGRPVVLSGTVVPVQFERRPERAFFSEIHYLGLVCEREVLRTRLAARPAWREWDEPRITEMLEFNEWLCQHGPSTDPPVELLDTTTIPLDQTVDAVAAWVDRGLADSPTVP